MSRPRPVRLFGDGAVLVETESVDEAHRLAAAVDRLDDELEEVVVGYCAVTVVADPTVTDLAALGRRVASLVAGADPGGPPATVEVPVDYDGPDLVEVADLAGITPETVATLLAASELVVAFTGFSPGFAYLSGLPPALATVLRRSAPRAVVPAGSVALAGGFAGVYPQASPGGWHVVGRTDMVLFDPDRPPYARLRPGGRVRLVESHLPPVAGAGAGGGRRAPLRAVGPRVVVVEEAGWCTTVQDGGRRGVAALGVPRAGGADPFALRLANRLVGNDDDAAVIETTARGPRLRFAAATHVAVVGSAAVTVDGRSVPAGAVVPVGRDQTLSVGDENAGLHSYVAVAGGIEAPTVFDSRSSDALSGLGPGALRSGDVLGFGPAGRPRGRLRPPAAAPVPAVVRVLPGPDPVPAATLAQLLDTTWEVDPTSDRIGVRLRAERPLDGAAVEGRSRGMVTGAVQLPPDGWPIVLSCDHAPVGGYPVPATVVSADVGIIGQLRPGSTVRFVAVDAAEAVAARVARHNEVEGAVVGWYPVRTD